MSDSANLVLRGTRYYAAGEEYRSGRLKAGSEIFLVHTPYNPYDKNAVAVYLMPAAKALGHLARQIAPKYSVIANTNRIKSAKVVTVEKSSSSSLRIEVRLALGAARRAGLNDSTGTTQIIPSILEAKLRTDRRRAEKAHYDHARSNVNSCEQAVAAAKTILANAQKKLTHHDLNESQRAALRQSNGKSTTTESRTRWVGSATGVVVGGMAGGPGGALLGGIVGLVEAFF